MQVSYQDLIDDHDCIEQSSVALLDALRAPGTDAVQLDDRLGILRILVADHLAIEHMLVEEVSGCALSQHWIDIWRRGEADLATLRHDWTTFLSDWNSETIAYDTDAFRSEGEHILSRLRERVRSETAAIYATALQYDVVTLQHR